MPLIKCKVELKLKWTNHCILSATSANNDDANFNHRDIILNSSNKSVFQRLKIY